MPSQHVLTFPFYLPRVLAILKNWPRYLGNYLLRRGRPDEYIFRSGLRLFDGAGTLAGTIAVVFIRREYGDVVGFNVIVDIGANMGCFATFAAFQSPNAKIYCFEPEPRNFAVLSKNLSINSLGNRVLPFQAAVSSDGAPREMVFGESPLNSLILGFTAGTRKLVQCTTLHDIIERNNFGTIDLLKVNCEGAEYEIFAHCNPIDLKRVSNIRVEYHNLGSSEQNGEWLARFFVNHGFIIERFTRYKTVSGFIWARQISK